MLRLLGRLRHWFGCCDMGPQGHDAFAEVVWRPFGSAMAFRLCGSCFDDLVAVLGRGEVWHPL